MIVEALRKMQSAGFSCDERDGALLVKPRDKLSAVQVSWIKEHKSELLRQIVAMRDPHLKQIIELFDADVRSYERV